MAAPPTDRTAALAFNGTAIRALGDYLNLTDMWKADGAKPDRRPVIWLRSAEAARFSQFLTETLMVRNSHHEENQSLTRTVRGGNNPYTEAHWQLGMAYAKYLSPEFHAWCNTVVRDHMEGRLLRVDASGISEFTAEQVLSSFTNEAQKLIAPVVASLADLAERIDFLEDRLPQRRPISLGTKADVAKAVLTLGRRCPCCSKVAVVDEQGGVIAGAEFDHFYSNQLPTHEHVWLICKDCHGRLTAKKLTRQEATMHFFSFQLRRAGLSQSQTQ